MLGLVAMGGVLAWAPPAAAGAGDGVAPELRSFYAQEPSWNPCDGEGPGGLECAEITVPMDYSKPEAEKIRIAISRRKASDRDHRRGILLLNPGGPGGSGLGMPGFLGDQRVGEVYDLIGFDPRGVGRSTNLNCSAPDAEEYELPSRPTDAQLHNFTEAARTQEEGCDRTAGSLRPHITTANTARDMDVIRGALGEDKTNYLGYSYGTYLGAVYGSLFPDRLDRSVLDSSVHPDRIWRDDWKAVGPATTENVDRFAEWAADHDDKLGLGKDAKAVRGLIEDLAQRLHEQPFGGLTRTDFDLFVGDLARWQGEWDLFADTLTKLRDGAPEEGSDDEPDADAQDAAEAVDQVAAASRDRLMNGTYNAILCEADWPTDLDVYYDDMRNYRENHPYGWGVAVVAPNPCTFRSYTPPEKPVTLERAGYPTGVVIQGEYDPQTPYEGGPAMAKRLHDNLIIVKDDGNHGYYGGPDYDCVTEQIDDYLIDGILPGSATTCPGVPRADLDADTADEDEPLAEQTRTLLDEREEDFPVD
ncbi:alpha/beta fold hydrolase [Nocardiopsis gilva]|uniref:alpha/beta fold hydrolase n=1 Tax=Nocardiopsis gilva TaxID=280236 RepID=UPI0012FD2D4E|nr:alpha/beta fold hydrolase [Nocardiopsis gilva]